MSKCVKTHQNMSKCIQICPNSNQDKSRRVRTGRDRCRWVTMGQDGSGQIRTGQDGSGSVQTSPNLSLIQLNLTPKYYIQSPLPLPATLFQRPLDNFFSILSDDNCQYWINLDDMILSSPNYPKWYNADGVGCEWLISAQEGFIIALEFNHFHVIL